MKFNFSKHAKKTVVSAKKVRRFNPHRYWRVLLVGSFLGLLLVFSYFALFFIHTSNALDAPVEPVSDDSFSKIRQLERDLQKIKETLPK